MKRDKLRYRMKIYNVATERKRGPGRPGPDSDGGPPDGGDAEESQREAS
jgi:hypothetical protein